MAQPCPKCESHNTDVNPDKVISEAIPYKLSNANEKFHKCKDCGYTFD